MLSIYPFLQELPQLFDTVWQPIQRHHLNVLNDGRITAAYFRGVWVENQNTSQIPNLRGPPQQVDDGDVVCRQRIPTDYPDGGSAKLLFGGIPNRS